jgi:hypothetical protein
MKKNHSSSSIFESETNGEHEASKPLNPKPCHPALPRANPKWHHQIYQTPGSARGSTSCPGVPRAPVSARSFAEAAIFLVACSASSISPFNSLADSGRRPTQGSLSTSPPVGWEAKPLWRRRRRRTGGVVSLVGRRVK